MPTLKPGQCLACGFFNTGYGPKCLKCDAKLPRPHRRMPQEYTLYTRNGDKLDLQGNVVDSKPDPRVVQQIQQDVARGLSNPLDPIENWDPEKKGKK